MPRGKGFDHPPAADINQIRNLLDDAYGNGFPIVKELIQNADDAQASRLDIGWLPGLPGAGHPLFEGPALFVVNDGPFEPKNERAIRQLGLSNRAGEAASIGKFGLGLKSVFHLCEAFCYFSSAHPKPSDGLLNPWSGDDPETSFHTDWDELWDLHQLSLRARVQEELSWLLDRNTWFLLWLPLRRRKQLAGVDPIRAEFYGDDETIVEPVIPTKPPATTQLGRQIAGILPMLRRLEEVRVWKITSADAPKLVTSATIALQPGRRNRRRYPQIRHGERASLLGELTVAPNETLQFIGVESYLNAPSLQALQQRPEWPRRQVITETGQIRSEPEKAEPHCAAYFVRSPRAGSTGQLRIWRSIFLPIGDAVESIICGGDADYDLFLHGYGFPDHGRSRIDHRSTVISGVGALRAEWNDGLYQQGTLRQVLPALESLCSALDESPVAHLTGAIAGTNWFNCVRAHVCSEAQWVYRLKNRTGRWERIAAGVPVYELPGEDDSLAWIALPRLAELADKVVITTASMPRLTTEPLPRPWEPEVVVRLLSMTDDEAADVCTRPATFRYLTSWLAGPARQSCQHPLVAERLIAIARAALRGIDFRQFRQPESKEALARLLELLPPGTVWPVEQQGGTTDQLLKAILQLPMRALPVPREFVPEHSHPVSLSIEDAILVLSLLADSGRPWATTQAYQNVRSSLALAVVRDVGRFRRADLLNLCADLRLFNARSERQGQVLPFSWKELKDRRAAGFLFHDASFLQQELQRVLAAETVVTVRPDVHEILFDKQLPACREDACTTALLSGPTLAPPDERLVMIKKLQAGGVVRGSDRALAIRYLLHGDKRYVRDDQELLVSPRQAGTIWERLGKLALHQLGEDWRIIPIKLAGEIGPNEWTTLGITLLDQQGLVRLLVEQETIALDCSALTPEERQEALLGLSEHPDLLRRLPLHETIDGRLVAGDSLTYLETDGIDLRELKGLPATILRRHSDQRALAVQRQLFPELDAIALACLLTQVDEPQAQALRILDALGRALRQPTDEEIRRLRLTSWLPSILRQPVAPADLIVLPKLADEVDRICAESPGPYYSPGMLAPSIREHPSFPILTDLLCAKDEGAVRLLGQQMEMLDRYHLGLTLQPDDLEAFSAVLGTAPKVLPAAEIIAKVRSSGFPDGVVLELASRLARPLPAVRLLAILDYLKHRHQERRGRSEYLLRIHARFLTALAQSPDWNDVREQLVLLSRAGSWRPIQELTCDADGVDPHSLLDQRQAEALSGAVFESGSARGMSPAKYVEPPPPTIDDFKRSAKRLVKYLESFRGVVPDEVIGAFLAICGDQHSLVKEAERYLGRFNLRSVRDMLHWTILTGRIGGAGEDVHQTMARQRFVVEILDGTQATVTNLLGERIDVQVAEAFDDLLVGDPFWGNGVVDGNLRYAPLQFRRITVADHRERAAELLLRTAEKILWRAFGQREARLDAVWQMVSDIGQLDLVETQNRLLDHAFTSLGTLRVINRELQELMREWDALEDEAAQARRAREQNPTAPASDAEKRLADVARRLRNKLEEDPGVQAAVLEAMRRSVGNDFQYTPTSVPFELFQNADDAVVELGELEGHGPIAPGRCADFVVGGDANRLTFAHWGRAINQYRSLRETLDGRERWFHRDLERMLRLNASRKGIDSKGAPVTGRFGLGFKSTLLVSDEPRVVSKGLSFRIVGGFYPATLPPADIKRLEGELSRFSNGQPGGTLFELPLRQAPNLAPEHILDEFYRLCYLLVVFARRLRRCIIQRPERNIHAEWQPSEVLGLNGIRVGTLEPTDGGAPSTGLQLDLSGPSTNGASLLLSLDARGVRRLPADVPTIWVTAPTQHRLNLGFAINAPFDLDVGRVQIAPQSKSNPEIVAEIGEVLADRLAVLFASSQGERWPELRDALNLARHVTAHAFWQSFWEVLGVTMADWSTTEAPSGPGSVALSLLRQMLWGSERHGMAHLLVNYAALPTGLPGKYETVVLASGVRHVIAGCLEEPDTFAAVCQWPAFAQKVAPGQAVSEAKVWAHLRRLQPNLTGGGEQIGLETVIRWEATNHQVPPELATRFGKVIRRNLLDRLELGTSAQRAEADRLRSALRELRFMGADGRYHRALDLLVRHDNSQDRQGDRQEERLRAGFAPRERVLAREYDQDGLAFFYLCRGALQAQTERMAEWGLAASSEATRKALLEYLLTGEQHAELARKLRERLDGSWLANLEQLPLFHSFDARQRGELLMKLGLRELERATPQPMIRTAPGVIERIADWWFANPRCVHEYERWVYDGRPPRLHPDDVQTIWDDIDVREEWLTLFVTAATLTIGRTKLNTHGTFLRLLRNRGWLRRFAAPDSTADDWIGVLDEFLRDGIQHQPFYQFMKQFVSIYQSAKWLDEYIRALLSADRFAGQIALESIFSPRTVAQFQFGALEAPSLEDPLGIGVHFLVRELVRLNILHNPEIYSMCYVPAARVRVLLIAAGCEELDGQLSHTECSRIIADFLLRQLGDRDRATFGRCFDIPLLLIDSDDNLRQQFFGIDADLHRALEGDADWVAGAMHQEVRR